MADSVSSLAKMINKFCLKDGLNETPIEGIHCLKFSKREKPVQRNWHRSIVIVAQGTKVIELNPNKFRFESAHYILSPIDLPVTSSVPVASASKPYLGLLINFDPIVLEEVGRTMKTLEASEADLPSNGIFGGKADDRILDCAMRLIKLFETPEDAGVLADLVIRELYFYLLKGPNGKAIRQFVQSGSRVHHISRAIQGMMADISREINVAELATRAQMSRAVFFRSFKHMTSMSPIQYQKKLRLIEARRLMTEEGETAENSAYRVGYGSASQFSREYVRMFGTSPARDVRQARRTRT